jgi:hypothetical protein
MGPTKRVDAAAAAAAATRATSSLLRGQSQTPRIPTRDGPGHKIRVKVKVIREQATKCPEGEER